MAARSPPTPAQRQIRSKARAAPNGEGRRDARPPPGADGVWPASREAQALCQAADACNAAFAHITQDADDVDLDLTAAIVDCAELCGTTAAFIMRGSEHADRLRRTCAEVAKDVEESCEEYPQDDHLKACADACRAAYEVLNRQGSPRVA